MEFETIPAKKIYEYIGKYNTVIVDLRCRDDYEEGHIPTAINIPYEEFQNQRYQLSQYDDIILYCDRGGTSMVASRELDKLGYHVINMYGGIRSYRGELSMEEINYSYVTEFFIDCVRKVI